MEAASMVLSFLALFASVSAAPYYDKPPSAYINQTVVMGSWMTSPDGKAIAAFRGIPYAKPPVGDLRFRKPEPLELRPGILNASVDGPMCIQKNVLAANAVVTGQEDCLVLNVYTKPGLSKLPVMVYIHGGAWFGGSAISFLVSPQFLLAQDIVLVTLNYRLGVFGFLNAGDADAAGNMGMKDQVLALRWVRDNVEAFGGDPKSVTIFGQSAGAGSVHLHMLSPMSRGLFHRAISQSGSSLAAWAFPTEDPVGLARRHGALVGCGGDGSTQQLVSCLRKVDAAKLVDATDQLKVWSIDPLTLYRITVETAGTGEERFLPAAPLHIIRDALASPGTPPPFARLPWLTGVVGAEGIIRAVPILTDRPLLADLNSKLDTLMPVLLELEGSVGNASAEVWQRIKGHFFPGVSDVVLGDGNAQAFIDIYSDRSFNHPLHNTVLYHKMAGQVGIYVYSFQYRGMYSYTNVFANTTKDYGVSHCDDLLYLLPAPAIFHSFPKGSADWTVVDALVTLWTNFAKYGQPAPRTRLRPGHQVKDGCVDNVGDVLWPTTTGNKSVSYLEIAAANGRTDGVLRFCMRDDLLAERSAFWDSLPLVENSLRQL